MSIESRKPDVITAPHIRDIYTDCLSLVEGQIESEKTAGIQKPNGDFRSFQFIPSLDSITNRMGYEHLTTEGSATWISDDEKEKFKNTPVDMNIRVSNPTASEKEPTVLISIPESVNLFMALNSDRAIVIEAGTRIATDNDLIRLQGYLSSVFERREAVEAEEIQHPK